MKITQITVHQVDLPLREGTYSWSGGQSIRIYDSTVVRIHTDAGLIGQGEVCPLGPAYLPAYANGARTGIAEIGAASARPGSARSSACSTASWTSTSRAIPTSSRRSTSPAGTSSAQLRRCRSATLLGGRHGDDVHALSRDLAGHARAHGRAQSPSTAPRATASSSSRSAAMPISTSPASAPSRRSLQTRRRAGGRRQHRLDCMHEAARVVRRRRGYRRLSSSSLAWLRRVPVDPPAHRQPFVLDEIIDGPAMLVRAHADGAMDVVNLKIEQGRRPHRARQMRDFCVAMGIAMTIEDLGGRHRHRRDRPSRPFDARGLPLQLERRQRLQHPEHRRRRPAAARRLHQGADRCRPWRDAVSRRARQGRADDRLIGCSTRRADLPPVQTVS